jgi:hypothetical protein
LNLANINPSAAPQGFALLGQALVSFIISGQVAEFFPA